MPPPQRPGLGLLTGDTVPPLALPETTLLSPQEESQFQQWALTNRLPDVDHPESHYDYRGFWKSTGGAPHPPGAVEHFPDTYKQHGHPTFSQESQYSRGPMDGAMWVGDTPVQPPPMQRPSAPPPGPPLLTGQDPRGTAAIARLREQPSEAWRRAETIGASRVGERYAPATFPEIMGSQNPAALVSGHVLGSIRPRSVQGQDPTGIQAWEMGAGEMPMFAAPIKPAGLAEKIAAHLNVAPVERVNGRLFISTRIPTAVESVKAARAAPPTEPLVSGLVEAKSDPVYFKKMAQSLRRSPILTEHERGMNREGVVDAFVNRAAENLDVAAAMQPRANRVEAAKWYRGGHNIGNDLAATTTAMGPKIVTPDQGTFLLASQSPTREWPQNMSLAERMARWWQTFNNTDQQFTQQHFDRFVDTTRQSTEDWILKKKQIGAAADKSRARAAEKIADAQQWIDRPWSELPVLQKARLVRSHSELNELQHYPILDPTGNVIEATATTPDGKPRVVVWQSYGNIVRGLEILNDGSDANLSWQVGKGQKVRHFANSLNVPDDPRSFVTDTHEVAAANLQPLGGGAKEVKAVMAGPASAKTGLKGFSPAYHEAGRLAASHNRVLPNQMQSISWEGIQGLFSSAQRRDPTFQKQIYAMWKEHSQGKISLDQLYGEIFTYAAFHGGRPGLIPPDWQK